MNWQTVLNNKKTGVFFSDPGGAKPLLSLHALGNSSIEYFSNKQYDFYNLFTCKVHIITEADIKQVILKEKYDIILCGTSYTNDFELKALTVAKQQGVFSYSFIDNWSGFDERFLRNNKYTFPDEIIVIDNKAKRQFQNKCDENNVQVQAISNPYFDWLQLWKPSISKEKLFEIYGLNSKKKCIIYAPDPLSNVGGVERFGFDEYTAYEHLFLNANCEVNLIFKFHPNQHITYFENKIHSNTIIVKDNKYVNELLFYSDLVVSFFSGILLETKHIGGKPLRYLYRLKGEDIFQYENVKKYDSNKTIFEYLNE